MVRVGERIPREIRKNYFMGRLWNRLAESPSLGVFKTRVDVALGDRGDRAVDNGTFPALKTPLFPW